MGTTEAYERNLTPLLAALAQRGEQGRLLDYLRAHSHLPGPRGNLELGRAFARQAALQTTTHLTEVWTFCISLTRITPEAAPVNSREEFLPFCGTWAFGSVAVARPALGGRALTLLRRQAHDPRWRTREAVAMGLQMMLAGRPQVTINRLKSWITDDDWLAMRAAAAAVAEPALLREARVAAAALALHRRIFARLGTAKDRTSDAFRILRQGLGYSLSVVVAARPKPGFRFLMELARRNDPDVQWIVRANLTKQRLLRADPRQVRALARQVAAGCARSFTPGRGRPACPPRG